MSDLSRRRFLTIGAGVLGGAAAGSMLPPALRQALATPAPPGGMRAIEHVVVFMQENRSFDNYFGTLRGVRGFADRTALELPDGNSVFAQPDGKGGRVLPFSARLAAEQAQRPDSDVQYLGSLDHSWETGHEAWASGWVDRWVNAKSASTMAFYDRRDIPLQTELAETFTLCDSYHCSLRGPTNPNRLYLWTGTVGYEPGTRRRVVGNDASNEDTHPGYDWTTYPERLEQAGVSWQTYQEWDNYGCNSVEYFARFKQIARKALTKAGDYRSMHTFFEHVVKADEATRKKMLSQLDAGVATLTPAERSLYQRGLRRVPSGKLAESFRDDVRSGRLPRVSYIVPSTIDSEHPSESTPANSAEIVYQVLDALASNPDVWSRTALFLNFDENDGYFDHVPPPVPPPEHTDEYYEGKPLGLGHRVPMTVVSPWTVGGNVCSEVFDHTSVIRFLEEWTGVREPNISSWRRTATGDLTSAFDFTAGSTLPRVRQPGPVPPQIKPWTPKPPSNQVMPPQEEGRRPARALPYRPEASAQLVGKALNIALENAGARSAHFAIYAYRNEFDAPRHFDVSDAHTEKLTLGGNDYRLAVHGPNGFLRSFAGHVNGAAAATVTSTGDASGQSLGITLHNGSDRDLSFRLAGAVGSARERTDDVHLRPGEQREVRWTTDQGWYDLEITALEEPGFSRRLAGKVENGKPGVTA